MKGDILTMRKNNILFMIAFSACLFACCASFQYAGETREITDTIGGEVFTLALPIWLIIRKLDAMRAQLSRLQRRNRRAVARFTR